MNFNILLAAQNVANKSDINMTIFTIIMITYLLAIAFLGWRGYKGTKTASDYLVAGRDIHPYIMALSYGATFVSTSAIIGFGGVAGLFGLSLLWLTFLNIGIGILIAFIFLGKRTRRMSHHIKAHTFSELLGKRYQSKFIQVSTAIIILTMVLYAAAVLIGAGRHLESIMGMNFDVAMLIFILITAIYVIGGGLKGVMYTDALQGTLMFAGILILLIIGLSSTGGFSGSHKKLDQVYKKVISKTHLVQKINEMALKDKIILSEDQRFSLAKQYMRTWKMKKGLIKKYPNPVQFKKALANHFAKIRIEDSSAVNIKMRKTKLYKDLVKKYPQPSALKKALAKNFNASNLKISYVTITPEQHLKLYNNSVNYVIQFFILNDLKNKGHQGWDKMPKANTPVWWLIVSTIMLGVGIGVLAQPQLTVRFMTVKSDKELNRSILVGGVFILVITGFAYFVGTSSNIHFFEANNGLSSIGMAGGNIDKIMPLFLKDAAPSWFNYIFLITLIAAAMSTISSQFHTMGTAISRDIFEATGLIKIRNENDQKKSIIAAKLGIGVMIILTIIVGYALPEGIIAAATAIFFGLCASAFLPSLIGALYWKGATKAGAIASIITGFTVTAFWLFFIHEGTLKKLGGKSLIPESMLRHVDPLIIALPLSILVFIIVGLLSEKLDKTHVDNCFAKIGK